MRRILTLCAALVFVALPIAVSAQLGRYTGFFQEIEPTRDEAYLSAVISVTREALGNLLRDENWNPELLDCLEGWIKDELAPDYDDLVANALFDVDRELRGQWALEGSMAIENGFLNRWVRRQINDGACGPGINQRFTIYLEPVQVADPAVATDVETARKYVQEAFSRNGFTFVDSTRRQSAEARLILDNAKFSASGQVGTMLVTGMFVDNRADNQPFLAINAAVNERLRTTEADLKDALFRRQAQDILARVREFFVPKLGQQDVEIVFLSRRTGAAKENAALDAVADLFDLPRDFRERPDAVQTTALDNGVEISILIPARYGVTLTRTRIQELRTLAEEVLDFDIGTSEYGSNASRLMIVDASAVAAPWERDFWRYLDADQLVLPEEASALGVVRRQLRADANDRKALGFLDEIVSRLVQRAIYKLGQGALSSANADLTLAESLGRDRPGTPWVTARRELDLAMARQRERVERETVPAAPGTNVRASPPLVLFPQLESPLTRAISVAPAAPAATAGAPAGDLLGLAADVQGIKRIEINGDTVEFGRASPSNAALLTVPGATTQEFHLPPALVARGADLRVTVVDGGDQRTQRTLVSRNGAYTVRGAGAADVDDGVLKEGQAALSGHYHALIIANEDYTRTSDLRTPRRDAEALQAVLIEQYNFAPERVYTFVNLTGVEMRREIDRLQEKVGPNDSLLIYYAGHGYQDLGHAGTGYWIPVDGLNETEPDHRITWIDTVYIADYVEKVKARHVLLISDSCFAGTFAQRGAVAEGFVATEAYALQKAGRNSRRAITSGDIEPVADGGGDGHSIFAHHLLRVLREQPGKYLTAEQLYKGLFQAVTAAAPQTPQYFVMADNDRNGDFVFMRRGN